VVKGDSSVGVPAPDPVLNLRPDVATIRLKPNDARRYIIHPTPEDLWTVRESMALTFDPPVKELQVTRISQLSGEEVTLQFVEPEGLIEDEYPIETVMRATATFKGQAEPRILERRVVINPPKERKPRPTPPLKDDPTFIKVTSRQPIKILLAGPDVHVK